MISVGIRGAGLAGLVFAQELLANIPEASISIFDLRQRLPHPTRTFCFFRDSESYIPITPDHEWSSVVCSGQNFRRVFPCSSTPYTLIRGDTLFTTLLAKLEAAGVSFVWGCRSVEATSRTITADAKLSSFDLVVDAAFSADTSVSTLWQSFGGMWVRSDRPLFDPLSATLMDLDVPNSRASVRFMYLLPTSPTTALLEHTVFARTPLTKDEHLTACAEWADRQGYTRLEVCENEYGRIPMGLQQVSDPQQPLRIGTAGGAVRISTGYGFQAIVREAKQLVQSIASALANGKPLPLARARPWPRWMRFCDTLFVRALAQRPTSGQFIMAELLRNAPERALIPFLAGTASLSEALQVMRKVPKWDMLKALVSIPAKDEEIFE